LQGLAVSSGVMSVPATAIRVEDLEKSFRIPRYRMHTIKERALHPFRRHRFDEFNVIRGISFEVARGEFFGIVGRNGSGKSTLLKCIAGIYRTDAGSIHLAGRLSPFIELGVGFNPDLPARDNVMINAVMMGLSPRVARDRFEEILAFAELERFADTKLKNYSSGMQVRLAFSVMVHTDPDVMLIDEVLAVGDAAFQQKCLDVFYRLRDEGKTIILVTHAMGLVEQFCHRAILLSGGKITQEGDPGEIARAYMSENFRDMTTDVHDGVLAEEVRLIDAWMTGSDGERVDTVAYGNWMRLHVAVEALRPIDAPSIAMWLSSEDRVRVFSAGAREDGAALGNLEPGERIEFAIDVENRLSAGKYYLGCSVARGTAGLDVLYFQDRAADIVSYGASLNGLVGVDYHVHVTRSRAGAPVL
jgi:ABC-2 type transport system ATP-binding protein